MPARAANRLDSDFRSCSFRGGVRYTIGYRTSGDCCKPVGNTEPASVGATLGILRIARCDFWIDGPLLARSKLAPTRLVLGRITESQAFSHPITVIGTSKSTITLATRSSLSLSVIVAAANAFGMDHNK